MAETDKVFVDGFTYEPKEIAGAPWIKGKLYIRVDDAIKFLQKHRNDRGFVNIDVKEGKSGRWYCELNTWKPEKREKPEALQGGGEINPDDIPF